MAGKPRVDPIIVDILETHFGTWMTFEEIAEIGQRIGQPMCRRSLIRAFGRSSELQRRTRRRIRLRKGDVATYEYMIPDRDYLRETA